jgi:SAM-dependent methyltransferase
MIDIPILEGLWVTRLEEHSTDACGSRHYSSRSRTVDGHTGIVPLDPYRQANRDNWDSRVDIHHGSAGYQVSRFIDDPGHLSDVVRFDMGKLGPVAGRRLVHLQCHIGTDTLSWARLGAETTGIDLSPLSIEAAQRLSAESSTPGRFLVSELYDVPAVLPETFDIVYTGVGAICWLPDIRGWAEVVAGLLEPGGVFYMREGHPMMWAMDFESDDGLRVKYPYFETSEPDAGDGVVTSPLSYVWNHGIGETLDALIRAGLRIDAVEEYQECEWQGLESMVVGPEGRWVLPEGPDRLPLMWSVLATRV